MTPTFSICPQYGYLAGERVNGWETVRRHKNGTVIQVAVTCAAIRAHTGEVTAVACIARDIRRQKLQERLVGESHQRLKLALESAALALWDWDIPGGRVFYSDELAGLLQLKDRFVRDDVIVVIFHDHGSRYLGKMFNDDWMREKGFFERTGLTARDLVASGVSGELLALEASETVEAAVRLMSQHDFSQISITSDKRLVGSLNEAHLYAELVRNPDIKGQPVETIMQPAFPFADISTPLELLATMITSVNPAVLVRDFKTEKTFIITRSDVIRVLC